MEIISSNRPQNFPYHANPDLGPDGIEVYALREDFDFLNSTKRELEEEKTRGKSLIYLRQAIVLFYTMAK